MLNNEAYIKLVHPHQLRHTYCRELVGAGVNIATVAELAGHVDINVTQRYTKPPARKLEKAVEKAFRMFNFNQFTKFCILMQVADGSRVE